MEGAEEPSCHEIEHTLLVLSQRACGRRLAGRNDRVVVMDLRAIEHTTRPTGRFDVALNQGLRERRVVRNSGQSAEDPGQLALQIKRQVARIRAWVGQDLVAFVERLRGLQSARRRHPVAPIGRALKRRQVE